MKAAPVLRALDVMAVRQVLIHTGQHYDGAMSDTFFQQLELPEPVVNLDVGSGSHAQQTADVMTRLEGFLESNRPDVLVVYGDVNSTMAAALVAAKSGIPIAHVEAGLRSFDRSMPEEINRLVTDSLSSVLFTPSPEADENLRREGVNERSIHRVGNVMIDTLVRLLPIVNADELLARLKMSQGEPFVLVTLHRPSSVDDADRLSDLIAVLCRLADDCPVVFPVHPRTKARIPSDWVAPPNLHLLDPVGYLEFVALEKSASLVVTDSGGVQEETTYLGIPCLTFRDNTERPVTITEGTNKLVGRDPAKLLIEARRSLARPISERKIPDLWDGRAAERIAAVLLEKFS